MNLSEETGRKILVLRNDLLRCIRRNEKFPNQTEGVAVLVEYIKVQHNLNNCSQQKEEIIKKKLTNLFKTLKQYWIQCSRTFEYLVIKHANWLNGSIEFLDSASDEPTTSISGEKRGRPSKDFTSSSAKSKKRKVEGIVEQHSLSELCLATERKLRREGKRDAADLVQNIIASPKRATNVKKIWEARHSKKPSSYSAEEALSMMVSCKLTKHQYLMLRQGSINKGVSLYPSYHKITEAKVSCYPPAADIVVTDTMAEIKLQSIVDLTVKRLFMAEKGIVMDGSTNEYIITFKWGCDGCGSHNQYKQRGSLMDVVEDTSVLCTSLVPINIMSGSVTVWKNPRTSSTRFCRPIRFRFVKETELELLNEISYIQQQIRELRPAELEMDGKKVTFLTDFLLTMVDGKVCNALAHNASTQTCFICGATPKIMNNLTAVKQRPCEDNTFAWGISSLHACIRFMECFLHISYKLCIGKWQARTVEEKTVVKRRKEEVITRFRSETGLLLDTPKQGGGNTNDGNSARRFFRDAAISASITSINQQLIERCGIILKVISSGLEIDEQKFDNYASETAELFVKSYDWYPMPVTVHKVLIHGCRFMLQFSIPIGQLSEDVQEIRHKEFKKFREHFSRKMSRVQSNRDVLNQLLISSDPVITSFHNIPSSNHEPLSKEVCLLLKIPDDTYFDADSDNDLGFSDMSL